MYKYLIIIFNSTINCPHAMSILNIDILNIIIKIVVCKQYFLNVVHIIY